jgi:protein-tyrosine phosphatase
MVEYYESAGIKAIHFPIHDFNEDDLRQKMYKGAEVLNEMINKDKLDVYVHCTAGMGRAPAVVLCYLCLW